MTSGPNPTEASNSTAGRRSTASGGQADGTSAAEAESKPLGPATERGKTVIADAVVEKIAGMAAREVPGIHALGGSLSRTLGAVRDRVPVGRPTVTRGVSVAVGELQAAVDLELVIEYDVPIAVLAAEVRENVVESVERMTGLEVVEVNIAVTDVHLPGEDDDAETDPRVQ